MPFLRTCRRALALCGLVGLSLAPVSAGPQAPPAAAPTSAGRAYLFTYFTRNGEDGLHLAWSADGYRWERLNGGKSYLTPAVGKSKLMRDPCVVRGPDGTYHMVWTSGWNENNIGYASTRDFVTWSAQREVPVMAHEPTVLNSWAPEIVYVPGEEVPADGDRRGRLAGTVPALGAPFTPTGLWVEGPTALKIGDHYVVYFDAYTTKHYGALRSRDLVTWEDATNTMSFPDEGTDIRMRHGTVIEVPAALVAALRSQKG